MAWWVEIWARRNAPWTCPHTPVPSLSLRLTETRPSPTWASSQLTVSIQVIGTLKESSTLSLAFSTWPSHRPLLPPLLRHPPPQFPQDLPITSPAEIWIAPWRLRVRLKWSTITYTHLRPLTPLPVAEKVTRTRQHFCPPPRVPSRPTRPHPSLPPSPL